MSDVNTVAISGNLSADPEAGNNVVLFCVAVNRSVKKDDGTYGEAASFIDCKVFGNRAAPLAQILKKGMPVTVQGELRQDRWQDQDGNNRSKVVVVAREVKLPPRQQQGHAQGQPQAYAPQAYQAQPYQPQPYAPQPAPAYQPQAYQAQPYAPEQPKYAPPMAQPPMDQVYDEEIPF